MKENGVRELFTRREGANTPRAHYEDFNRVCNNVTLKLIIFPRAVNYFSFIYIFSLLFFSNRQGVCSYVSPCAIIKLDLRSFLQKIVYVLKKFVLNTKRKVFKVLDLKMISSDI